MPRLRLINNLKIIQQITPAQITLCQYINKMFTIQTKEAKVFLKYSEPLIIIAILMIITVRYWAENLT